MKKNPTVIISGATKGIGYAIAHEFAKHGATIYLAARTLADLKDVQQKLTVLNTNNKIHIYSVDFAKQLEIEAFTTHIINTTTKIDVLVNNVGVFALDEIENIKLQDVKNLFQINTLSAICLTTPFIPILKKQSFGHLFNILSIASKEAITNATAYSISKFAMNAYHLALQKELKPFRIKVTGVYPGNVYTNSWGNEDKTQMIQASDIAQLVYQAYQTSDNAYIDEINLTAYTNT